MPSHNIPPSMLSTFPVAIRNCPSAVTSKNDSSTDAVCFHWAVLRFFHCCCFYYLCSSIIFVLTCVLSRCLRVASSPLQSSLHLIHLTSLRRWYHPQPRQLELSLVGTNLCSWQGRFFTFLLINGNTYHSALGITLSKKQKPDIPDICGSRRPSWSSMRSVWQI